MAGNARESDVWMSIDQPVDMPREWGGVIPSEIFLSEAQRIAEEGVKSGLVLRAMGGVGIRLHSVDHLDLAKRLGRLGVGQQEFTDLDFMAYKSERKRMRDFFESIGYLKRRATLSSAASERQIYLHPKGWFFIDVFFDKLIVANHPIDLRNRLELDMPTVSVTDLLLEKLQIVNLGEKDLKDTVTLLVAHEVREAEGKESVNARYVAELLSKDWGFWYTVTNNLRGTAGFAEVAETMTREEVKLLSSRVNMLLDRIEKEPKTAGWKMRAVVGPRKRWYAPVETAETVGDFGIWRLVQERKRQEKKEPGKR